MKKDRTFIIYGDGMQMKLETIYYKDFDRFEDLPWAAQSEEIRIEFEEYKKKGELNYV